MKKCIYLIEIILIIYGKSSNGQLLTDTVIDYDGNVYQSVKIGSQTWMSENLRVTHYRNGEEIANVKEATLWCSLNTGAYCNYNNDSTLARIYGRLYNFYAVADQRNLCPSNWHVPSDSEWNILEKSLDNTIDTALRMDYKNLVGSKLKSTGNLYWKSPNKGATNTSFFSGLPGGFRNCVEVADYRNIGYMGYWFTSTIHHYIFASDRSLSWEGLSIIRSSSNFKYGLSVRCIKDY